MLAIRPTDDIIQLLENTMGTTEIEQPNTVTWTPASIGTGESTSQADQTGMQLLNAIMSPNIEMGQSTSHADQSDELIDFEEFLGKQDSEDVVEEKYLFSGLLKLIGLRTSTS